MKLTKKKALSIAIELWEWIVDNPGKRKSAWPGWEKYGKMHESCSLCEYYIRIRIDMLARLCDCPIAKKHKHCTYTAYGQWHPSNKEGGHAAAVEFLAQLKEL